MRNVAILMLLAAGVAFGQTGPVYAKVLSNSVTTGATASIRLASNNQFHQLTVYPSDITASSCSGGWSGQVQLEASTDGVTWIQFGNPITAVADSTGAYTSTAGAFGYVRVNYVSGNTTACALSVWYSGTISGYPSFNTPVPPTTVPTQIAGNAALYSGQQAVTGTAAALATQAVKQACVKALKGNVINVYVGPSGVSDATGYELAPDEAVCLPVNNVNLIYVIARTTGASVSWTGTN